MSARSSRSLAAGLTALVALVALVPAGLVDRADARVSRLRPSRAPLNVVNEQGDTIHIVRNVEGVTITREGIRIQGGETVKIPREPGSERRIGHVQVNIPKHPDIDIDVIEGDSGVVRLSKPGSGDIVNLFQDVVVPAGQTVNGQVVAVMGDVRVYGAVEGDVVAVMGSVDVGDSARIGGEVVSVGGHVKASPTGQIQGQTVSVPIFGQPHMASWLPSVASLVFLLFFSFLGALVALLFPERLARISGTVSRRTLFSLLMGLATIPLLPIVFILLLITVVGIPVAFLLLLLYPFAAFVGYVASCTLIGARLRGRSVSEPPLWQSAMLGLAVVGAFFVLGTGLAVSSGEVSKFIGFLILGLGFLIGSVTVLLGLGALLITKLGEPERGLTPSRTAVPAGVPGAVAPGPAS